MKMHRESKGDGESIQDAVWRSDGMRLDPGITLYHRYGDDEEGKRESWFAVAFSLTEV